MVRQAPPRSETADHHPIGACLVADADEFFRIALKSILLARLGAEEVIEAGSFQDAITELTRGRPVSLALFDLDMPGMDGAAGVRRVRERFPDTQVAVVCASTRRSHILRALEAGAHGYIPKRLGVAELTRALELIRQGLIYVPSLITTLAHSQDHLAPQPTTSVTFEAEAPRIRLTPRQWEVLTLLSQGLSNKEIARALELGEGTVKVHVAAMFRTLGVTSRAAAAAAGAQLLGLKQYTPSAPNPTRLPASQQT